MDLVGVPEGPGIYAVDDKLVVLLQPEQEVKISINRNAG